MFKRHSKGRRGVAMLLVMISLMAATIMTTAYVASRDNSPAIGENSASATAARWAAESGVELAVAVLETKEDWRSTAAADGGRILRNYQFGDGTLDVTVLEFGTGRLPDPNTQNVQIISTAMVNGVTQTVSANALLQPDHTADVDLSEFAIFVSNSLNMSNQATIERWPMAPMSGLGERLALGTRATGASSIVLANSAAVIDGTLYHPNSASNSLVSNAGSPALFDVGMQDTIPLPSPPANGELAPLLPQADLTMNGGTALITTDARYNVAEIKNNGVRTLKGNIKLVTDKELKINSGGKLVIDGNVKIVVFGSLEMDQGSIELKPNARLRMYVRGGSGSSAVNIRDGYIGDLRTDSSRDNTGKASWMDPQRITVFSMAPASGTYDWLLRSNSVVKGSLYAPHASKVNIVETSALYGRVAAKAVQMSDSAALFYDPALNQRTGYTNTSSAIYANDGQMLNAFKTLASLDSATLQLVADSTGTIIKTDVGTKLTSIAAALVSDTPNVAPTDPTPRPVQVTYDMVSFGSNVQSWEH